MLSLKWVSAHYATLRVFSLGFEVGRSIDRSVEAKNRVETEIQMSFSKSPKTRWWWSFLHFAVPIFRVDELREFTIALIILVDCVVFGPLDHVFRVTRCVVFAV